MGSLLAAVAASSSAPRSPRAAREEEFAASVLEGRAATREEIIAVMDADLFHRREDLPVLLVAAA